MENSFFSGLVADPKTLVTLIGTVKAVFKENRQKDLLSTPQEVKAFFEDPKEVYRGKGYVVLHTNLHSLLKSFAHSLFSFTPYPFTSSPFHSSLSLFLHLQHF